MKKITSLMIFPLVVSIVSCGKDGDDQNKDSLKFPAALNKIEAEDSRHFINFIDSSGKKQGWWIVLWDSTTLQRVTGMDSLRALPPEKKTVPHTSFYDHIKEEGLYKNGLKEGWWKHYNPDMSVNDSVLFIHDREADDYLNFIDGDGKRKGHWIITGKMKGDAAYPTDAKVEEGYYVDGLKEGWWIIYTPDGKIKDSVFCVHTK